MNALWSVTAGGDQHDQSSDLDRDAMLSDDDANASQRVARMGEKAESHGRAPFRRARMRTKDLYPEEHTDF